MGIYDGSTWYQDQPVTPVAHPKPSSSNCKTTDGLGPSSSASSTSSAAPSETIKKNKPDPQSDARVGSTDAGAIVAVSIMWTAIMGLALGGALMGFLF
jgi:hypothetical protein